MGSQQNGQQLCCEGCCMRRPCCKHVQASSVGQRTHLGRSASESRSRPQHRRSPPAVQRSGQSGSCGMASDGVSGRLCPPILSFVETTNSTTERTRSYPKSKPAKGSGKGRQGCWHVDWHGRGGFGQVGIWQASLSSSQPGSSNAHSHSPPAHPPSRMRTSARRHDGCKEHIPRHTALVLRSAAAAGRGHKAATHFAGSSATRNNLLLSAVGVMAAGVRQRQRL